MDKIFRHIEQNLDDSIETLFELVRQPSISAQRIGFDKAPQLVAAVLERYGFDAEVLHPPNDGLPSVYGYASASPEAFRRACEASVNAHRADIAPPTLLLYTHYDVQPVDPLHLWDTAPFEPTRKADRFYGRGMSDDKGNIAARLAVIKAFQDEWGGLPCNVKFFAEGEEESGSPNLGEILKEHGWKLTADACIWEGGGRTAQNKPLIYLGLKGVLAVELAVESLSGDAHSSYATVLPSAPWRLLDALSTIKDTSNDRVLIQGFYDDVKAPTAPEEEALSKLPDDSELWRSTFGTDAFVNDLPDDELPLNHLFMPTANIAGLTAGYQGEGMKTVLPAEAVAKMDFRLVRDMDPDDVFSKLRAHLDSYGFNDVQLKLIGAVRPYKTDMMAPWPQLVMRCAAEIYDAEPVVYPTMAGSGPMHEFGELLGIPIASAGIDHPSHQIHAPNENIARDDFVLGAKHIARVMQRFAAGM